MNFSDYQQRTRDTAVYPDVGRNIVYPTLGLVGEAGEAANKVKKVIRDDGGVLTDQARAAIADELGDILWYVARLASEIGADLDRIAESNLAKLANRKSRNALGGSGDTR